MKTVYVLTITIKNIAGDLTLGVFTSFKEMAKYIKVYSDTNYIGEHIIKIYDERNDSGYITISNTPPTSGQMWWQEIRVNSQKKKVKDLQYSVIKV